MEESFTDELWNRVHGKHKVKKAPAPTPKEPSPKRQKVTEKTSDPDEPEDEDEWESEERKRKEDLADRDAFVERMKARDKERTKVGLFRISQ